MMTPKKRKFVAEYLVDGNATRAATAAGYKGARFKGCHLCAQDDIREAIEAGVAEVVERTQTTVDTIMRDLAALQDAAQAAKQYSAAIRAAELRGKHIGLWPDKIRLTHEFSTLTDAELVTEAARLLGGAVQATESDTTDE